MSRFVLVFLFLVLAVSGFAEPPAGEQLLGLWEVQQIKNLTTGEVQPKNREYHVYTKSHEMIILAGNDRKRIQKSISDMTPEEMMSQQPIGAGFYEYKLAGSKLHRTAVVTLSAFYEGRSIETEFEIRGDTLIVRDSHSADGNLREWTMKRVE